MKKAIQQLSTSLRSQLLLFSILTFNLTFAQTGLLDMSYGHPALQLGDSTRFGGISGHKINTIAIQPDGKIIAAGTFTTYNGINRNRIIRLNGDGSLDNSFNVPTGFNGEVKIILLQPDGKIIAGGNFTTYNGYPRNNIVRIDSTGAIDVSFTVGTGFNSQVNSLVLQTNGKIVAGGAFTDYNGNVRKYVARLEANGTIDATFSQTGTGLNGTVNAIVQDPLTYNIIAGGEFVNYNSITRGKLAGLNSDGTLDNNFIVGTGFSNSISGPDVLKLVRQPDGKILVGGEFFSTYNGNTCTHLLRVNQNGSLDNTFIPAMNVSNIKELIFKSQKVLATYYSGLFYRFDINGNLDNSFNSGTGFANNSANAMAVRSDGKIVAGGDFYKYNGVERNDIVLINDDGSTENTMFKINYGVTNIGGSVAATALQSDGKLIIGGNFSSYNDVIVNGLARLHTDGSLDTSFHHTLTINVTALKIQSNGKIIVGGGFGQVIKLARVNENGNIDNNFFVGSGFNSSATVNTIAIQANDKILVGGDFSSYDGVPKNGLVRLDTTGVLDVTFNSGTGFANSNIVYAISILPNQRIIAAGNLSNYNGSVCSGIVRILPNGTIDNTFTGGTVSNIKTMALQLDGKIIIGGTFLQYNSINSTGIARIDSTGLFDTSFNIGSGIPSGFSTNYEGVNCIKIQTDGKIIAGGGFTLVNGNTHNKMVRLNSNGSIDNSFAFSFGFEGYSYYTKISSIEIQPSDGKVIAAGYFKTFDLIHTQSLARLYDELPVGIEEHFESEFLSVYPNPTNQSIYLETGQSIGTYELYDINGRLLLQGESSFNKLEINLTSFQSGIYILKCKSGNQSACTKILKY